MNTDIIDGELVTGADMELRSDVDTLDQMDPESREVAVTGILQQSRDWLVRAQFATDPARAVSEFKAYIATVAETSKQLRLSKEIQQDASVLVRRAERSLGSAIRDGQANGTIQPRHFTKQDVGGTDIPSPHEIANEPGRQSMTPYYSMADNVTDDEFEDAIDQARAEDNVSRTNVVRKIKAGKGAYKSKAEPAKGNRRRAEKQLAVLRNITRTLGTLEMAVNELITAGFDTAMTQEETAEIIDGLNQFACTTKRIKKHLTN